jgi:hypothetical protein
MLSGTCYVTSHFCKHRSLFVRKLSAFDKLCNGALNRTCKLYVHCTVYSLKISFYFKTRASSKYTNNPILHKSFLKVAFFLYSKVDSKQFKTSATHFFIGNN